jgi:hypothetical protein
MLASHAEPAPRAGGDAGQTVFTATMTAFAVIAGLGWAVERRRRLASRVAMQPAAPVEFEPANLPVSQLQDFALPGSAVATPVHQREGARTRGGRRARKKLMRVLLWLRSVAGAAAILSAIAIVVFRAIEYTEVGAGDTGLDVPLLSVVVGGWAAFWGCGRLANMLHRALFNRDHPKFAD